MKKRYFILVLTITLVVSISASFAYWLAKVEGEGAPMTFTSTELKIVFTDDDVINANAIEPGWKTTKTFTVTSKTEEAYNYNLIIKNLINTFETTGYLQYKITSPTGYNMTEYKDVPKSSTPSEKVLAYNIEIQPNQIHTYTIEFIYKDTTEDQSIDMGKEFIGNLSIVKGTPDPNLFYNKLLSDNPTHTGQRPNAFSGVYTADNTGVMYVASGNQTEDGSNVYYFAGNAKNNWVKFGKNEQNQDLYWRIIRTNEDGSIRMLYSGTSPDTTEGYINGGQSYNPTINNPMYVGYMYGSSGSLASNRINTTNSAIKTTIDNWYASGLNTKTDASGNKYDAYISQTAIYCNDRANEGYSTSSGFYYATYYRLNTNKAPSYKCGNDKNGSLYTGTNGASNADKFSKSTSKGGNGKLQYPVALMTADEISFAGGLFQTNAPAWYYYNSETDSITGKIFWWTMSPYCFSFNNGSGDSVHTFYVLGSTYSGRFNHNRVNLSYAVRPVISIKSCTEWKRGNGAWNTPYEVELNNSCALAEN